jgi:hypothetical protein
MASCKNNKNSWGGKKSKQRKTMRKTKGGGCGCQKKLFSGGNLLGLKPHTYIPLNNEVNNPNTPAFVTDTRMQGVPVVKGGNKKRTNKRKGGKKKSSRKMKMQKGGYAYKPGDTTLAYTFGSSSGGIPNFSNALVGANTVNPSVDSQPISDKWGAHNPFLV